MTANRSSTRVPLERDLVKQRMFLTAAVKQKVICLTNVSGKPYFRSATEILAYCECSFPTSTLEDKRYLHDRSVVIPPISRLRIQLCAIVSR